MSALLFPISQCYLPYAVVPFRHLGISALFHSMGLTINSRVRMKCFYMRAGDKTIGRQWHKNNVYFTRSFAHSRLFDAKQKGNKNWKCWKCVSVVAACFTDFKHNIRWFLLLSKIPYSKVFVCLPFRLLSNAAQCSAGEGTTIIIFVFLIFLHILFWLLCVLLLVSVHVACMMMLFRSSWSSWPRYEIRRQYATFHVLCLDLPFMNWVHSSIL